MEGRKIGCKSKTIKKSKKCKILNGRGAVKKIIEEGDSKTGRNGLVKYDLPEGRVRTTFSRQKDRQKKDRGKNERT